jgi:hypothetical protein
MLSSYKAPVIVTVKRSTVGKSLLAKVLGLAIHLGILFIGTNIAEHAWRFWGGH